LCYELLAEKIKKMGGKGRGDEGLKIVYKKRGKKIGAGRDMGRRRGGGEGRMVKRS
jgi:hypothetical protein